MLVKLSLELSEPLLDEPRQSWSAKFRIPRKSLWNWWEDFPLFDGRILFLLTKEFFIESSRCFFSQREFFIEIHTSFLLLVGGVFFPKTWAHWKYEPFSNVATPKQVFSSLGGECSFQKRYTTKFSPPLWGSVLSKPIPRKFSLPIGGRVSFSKTTSFLIHCG